MSDATQDTEEMAAELAVLRRRAADLEQEVSTLRARQRDLERCESIHQGLTASTEYLVISVDPEGRFLYVNDLYCETFGVQRKDLLGNTFAPLVHEDDRAATMEAVGRLGRPPYRITVDQRALTPSGYRWFCWEDWALLDAQGSVTEIQAVGRDITQYRELAGERARLQEEIIEAQRVTLQEISTPLVPIADGVIAMPLVGAIDRERAQRMLQAILRGVVEHRADTAILDITGVKTIDSLAAGALVQAAAAVKLLGAQVILTGISPAIAQPLLQMGADLSGVVTRSTLQMGIAYAMSSRRRSLRAGR